MMLLTLLTQLAPAAVRLPSVLSDGMVIQQQAECPIWGWASPGEEVEVRSSWGQTLRTRADDDGAWRVTLTAPAASRTSLQITVVGENTITIRDVLAGEVWLASGQSNMEMRMSAADGGQEEAAAAHNPAIRFFRVSNVASMAPTPDVRGVWERCQPPHTSEFSAAAYWFAKSVGAAIDTPIGIIQSDWGGSRIEAWTPERTLRQLGGFDTELDKMEQEIARLAQHPNTDPDDDLDAWYASIAERAVPMNDWVDWTDVHLDETRWQPIEVPGVWDGRLASFDGIAWQRFSFDAPPSWQGRPIELCFDAIDDCDWVWLNGVEVGHTTGSGKWKNDRRYRVPEGVVRAGNNTIAVRILDTKSSGGIRGEVEKTVAIGPDGERISLAGTWRVRPEINLSSLPVRPGSLTGRDVASTLYNAMISPLTPLSIRGVIWYQGEAHRRAPDRYGDQFRAMIDAWREDFRDPELPFYFVQVAPFNSAGDRGEMARLRDLQFQVWQTTPHTGMVPTGDIGDPDDIHPRNKIDVGKRLASWALSETYGLPGFPCRPPVYTGHRINGSTVRIRFDDTQSLTSHGQPLRCFEIAGQDGQFYLAHARIEGSEVVVWSPEVQAPACVRFGHGAGDEPNVFDAISKLPVIPFQTCD